MAQHFLYLRPLPQGQGWLGENLVTVHKKGNALGCLPAQYALEIPGLQPYVALYFPIEMVEIIMVVDRIELTCETLESVEICFAAFPLNAVEVGGSTGCIQGLPDVVDTPEKEFELGYDIAVQVVLFSSITKVSHRYSPFVTLCFLLDYKGSKLNSTRKVPLRSGCFRRSYW
jgi:hypothetical protein